MVCNLNDIGRACGLALGGLKGIAIIDPKDLSAPILQYCQPSVGNVTLQTGKRSYDIKHILTQGGYTERLVTGNKAGDYYEMSVTFGIKKIRFEVESLIEKLKNRTFHLVLTHSDNTKRLCLNLRQSADTFSGNRIADRQGYTFNCSTRRSKKSPLMSGFVNSGTIDFSGDYHIFFKDVNGQYYLLTVDAYGSMVTTAASPTGYANVIIIAPPYGIGIDTLGALVTS